ncbi:MAG: glycoside hydrolase family 38 C-terminal domain-containing protein [Spirochaetota bacterium]|nr:glycoside hydrolase family 38 C-terminal domain-containing protein [Spirochaetota bacterium]
MGKIPQVVEDVLHIHIFSHTHWDFEWYEVHEGFKIQLVHLIDHLLDALEYDPNFRFHFDGQVMPIMDYLEILREEDDCDNKKRAIKAKRRISKLVKKGQLFIGPCWSTPETSLISNESLIRNINRGIRFSKKFGEPCPIFYNADAFQYHSQLPQIIKGTGLNAAFTWRAYKKGKTLKDIALWKGADKTTIPRYYPPRAYAQVWELPDNLEKTLDIIRSEAELLKNFSVTKHVLITQGNDQFEAQSDANQKITEVNNLISENYKVSQTTLEEFFNIIEKENPKLDILQGELTDNKWACTMSGQLSARIYLKQKNKEAEIAIEKWAEPFATFAWLLGNEYPSGLLERAWEFLMKQHFHHCNACAVDEVHREGEVRYKNAIELAQGIADESLKNLSDKIKSADIINKNENALVIFNPSDVERCEVVNIEIDIKKTASKDADWQLENSDQKSRMQKIAKLALKDEDGKMIPCQLLNIKNKTYEIAFWADKIPPFGYKTFALDFYSKQEPHKTEEIANVKDNVLENEIIKVKINCDGSFDVIDKRNGKTFKNLNIIEDTADHGDTYNYDPLKGDKPILSKGEKGNIVVKENGYFIATFQVAIELNLPESLTSDRKTRSTRSVKCPIIFNITLKKNSPLIFISANIDNWIKDHRLRVIFPGVKSEFAYVQTQGDVIKRKIENYKNHPQSKKRDIAHNVNIGDLPKEIAPSPTQFQRNFVGINNGERGLVILNKGLPEYEVKTDGTIALTLFRSVGYLSQDDLSVRERLAGPKISVPDAQCIRNLTFEYAILPQSGPWWETPVQRYENQYSIHIKSVIIPWQKGTLPTKLSFLYVIPAELLVSAIKKSYSDDNLIIRLFNPSEKKIKGILAILYVIKDAWLADLNENKVKKLPVLKDGSISIEVEPKKIITLSITPKNKFKM